jgi:hypothetical protein
MIPLGDIVYFARGFFRIAKEQARLVPGPLSAEEIKAELIEYAKAKYPALAGSKLAQVTAPVTADAALGMSTRKVLVSPMDGVTSSNVASVRWRQSVGQPGQSVLTIQPTRQVRFMGSIFFLLGLGVIVMGIIVPLVRFLRGLGSIHGGLHLFMSIQWLFGAFVCGIVGLMFTAAGAYLVLTAVSIVCDSRNQTISLNKRGGPQSRPWSDILGLQLVPGASKDFKSYQLNLLLDDPAKPRFNICDHGDLSAIEKLAARLADFLEKPLLRQL